MPHTLKADLDLSQVVRLISAPLKADLDLSKLWETYKCLISEKRISETFVPYKLLVRDLQVAGKKLMWHIRFWFISDI